ncbi:juvenile hormone acid O-methyltransferase-like [Odontomachus brunneus]|uniref:juvenile hormone acid O-methyltransferase-like n=1 Tax=Odontomachus brunneus TaxID=486640 RepID=UPI0013F2A203|nr:juvenile hormone acid O-methyltransferase-like [Odontomachus brunneus]XP_032666106.1 juvenile hormone acid O-methyltransferase-like [Odontomachus brunneus]
MTDLKEHYQSNDASHSTIQFIINEFEEELQNMSGKCTDIGCGHGDQTRNNLLPALNPKAVITGVDLSEDMIKHAIQAHSDEKRIEFYILDIEIKNLPEKYISKYDHVFSFYSLHWCNDIRQAFENIYRLLRPSGTMFAILIQTHDILEILLDMSKDIRYSPYMKDKEKFIPPFYNSIYPEKELKTLLKNIGFKVHHCSLRERTYSIQIAQKLPHKIMAFAQIFMENMPCDLKEQFKDEFIQEHERRRLYYKQLHNQEERIVSDLHEILVVYAKK